MPWADIVSRERGAVEIPDEMVLVMLGHSISWASGSSTMSSGSGTPRRGAWCSLSQKSG